MGKPTPIDREAADRIGRAAWERPDSRTARTGWDGRARFSAGKNEGYGEPAWDARLISTPPVGARLIRARSVNTVASVTGLS